MASVFSQKLYNIDVLVPVAIVQDNDSLQLGLFVSLGPVPDEGFVVMENGFQVGLQATDVLIDGG